MNTAIVFANPLGNFILMTSALRILRMRNDNVDLFTTKDCMEKNPAVKYLAYKLFDNVICKNYLDKSYDKVYCAKWSSFNYRDEVLFGQHLWWKDNGHEIQVYLDAINAGFDDFCGMEMPIDDSIVLDCPHPRVVLANASNHVGSRRGSKIGWWGFPELSRALVGLGYSVILGGFKDELQDCVGLHYGDDLKIDQMAGIIKQCDLMVCTDTGLMHVADALGVPIVLLSGAAPVTKSHPVVSKYRVVKKFISCAPCYQSSLWHLCKEPLCMKMIGVEDVLKEIPKLNEQVYL